ncbi:MAG: RNA polymerase factor sigma-54 [Porphyromonas sp.]|nr:RNA polymerase factor sigma-54 [Porphyromonas sp.]
MSERGDIGHSGRLKQRLGQRLSAQQIQLMQMVELPYGDFAQRIKQELEQNPALEEGSDDDPQADEIPEEPTEKLTEGELEMGDYADIDDVPDNVLRRYWADKTPGVEIPFSEEQTLQEHLREQVLLTNLDKTQQQIALFVIGSLDEDGYLRVPSESLVDDLYIFQGITVSSKELEVVIKAIQTLDPVGVAARSLSESLFLQLERKKETPAVQLAMRLVKNHFDAFAKKQFNQLIEATGATEEELRDATQLIGSLNPSPGLDYSTKLEDTFMTIIPDFRVTEVDGELEVTLYTAGIPEVRVSRGFEKSMSEYTGDLRTLPTDERATGRFVKEKIGEARWFVEMIRQRNNTLIETMIAIVDFQRDYFLTGDIRYLRPMILKDIADRVGYDISTISRVTSTKYVQTDFGTFSLKHFFSEGTIREDGEEVSTRHVRELLQELVRSEDKSAPLSDDALSSKLKEMGYSIARRTVAKYREQLNIPVARLRKEL